MTAPSQQRVQVAHLAALNEALALNDFYKNRNLVLANETFALREQLEAAQAENTRLQQEREVEIENQATQQLIQDDNHGDQT